MLTEVLQPYSPTPQEFNSWQVLKEKVLPDGAHDILPGPEKETKQSTPFAFNLGHEYQLAKEYGGNYKKYFIENAHYYAKESYGRVPVSQYEHKIRENEDGSIQLVLGPDNKSARNSYLEPALDTSKPEWYRKRSMGDVRWVDSMQKVLKDAEEGDTFIDLSPTEFNVSAQERKEWGYGYHSFARIHRVVTEENGQKKLVSRAVRNYLDATEQEILFEQLTGEKIGVSEMLGRVKKVNPGISQGYIRSLADKLYENTPHVRKIIPPPEYTEHIKNEREMDTALKKIDVWLEAVYEMIERGESPQDILKSFRGWENAVKDYVEGKSNLTEFENVSVDNIQREIYRTGPLISTYIERQYEPGSNGCGLGSGFSETTTNKDPMTYQSMTKTTESSCPEIKCKKCPWKANEGEVKQINNRKLTKCPKCGWKP